MRLYFVSVAGAIAQFSAQHVKAWGRETRNTMRFKRLARISFFVGLGCAVGDSQLYADEDVSGAHTLRCEIACAGLDRAVGLSQPFPPWPYEYRVPTVSHV